MAGRQQGLYRHWHEDGSLALEPRFQDGKPHGLSLAWHPSGFLKAEALMDQGEVESRHSYEDGAQREPTLAAKIQTAPRITSTQ